MTEQLEVRIPAVDLSKLIIECPTCKAEIVLNIADPKHSGVTVPSQGFFCTVCNKAFDDRIREAVAFSFAWHNTIAKAKANLHFLLKKIT